MAVLKNVNNLGGKILNMLISDEDIYDACDINVKRQIWLDFQSMFGDECSPLFQQYIQEKERLLTDALDVDLPFYSITPKQRRQNKIVQKFAEMVGDNIRLYETMVQFLRTLFVKTKNIHYCSLRVEFLMALHDKDVQEVTTLDPVHKFIWCLDACIREQAIDPKRSRELQTFLESIKPGQEHVLADISMVLCDPYAIHFLASSAFKIINHLITNGALPRGHTVLILILRCLNLGLHSWDIINSSVYREPRLDVKIFTKFLPMLMTIIVDDSIRSLASSSAASTEASSSSRQNPSRESTGGLNRESAIAIIEHSGPPPELFQKFIEKDRLAAVLAKHLSHFRVKFASSSKQHVASR
uniref:Negative elongation factor B n=1 Tax=Aceria tosichella TaxID=561515 RepID=A0A6G1SNE8_9ACAR